MHLGRLGVRLRCSRRWSLVVGAQALGKLPIRELARMLALHQTIIIVLQHARGRTVGYVGPASD